jgi:hypothetical protein
MMLPSHCDLLQIRFYPYYFVRSLRLLHRQNERLPIRELHLLLLLLMLCRIKIMLFWENIHRKINSCYSYSRFWSCL